MGHPWKFDGKLLQQWKPMWKSVMDECQDGSTQQMENVRKCRLRDYLTWR